MMTRQETESLGRLLSQICRLNRRHMHALLHEIGLYRGQPHALHALWEQEGLTHTQLAHALHLSAATMTNMLKRMEKAGFVERRPDPADERVSRVYLTDAGRAIQDRVRQVWRDVEALAFAGLEEPERARLRQVLLRIRGNLLQEPIPGGRGRGPGGRDHGRKGHGQDPTGAFE
jgi:DNA-binding MarR family transcriptional regulator